MAAGTEASGRPFIVVLAGVNSAGKSSVGGAMLIEHDLTWFNPNSFARELVSAGVAAEVEAGQEIPDPVLLVEMVNGRLLFPDPQDLRTLERIAPWARPIVQAAIELDATARD